MEKDKSGLCQCSHREYSSGRVGIWFGTKVNEQIWKMSDGKRRRRTQEDGDTGAGFYRHQDGSG